MSNSRPFNRALRPDERILEVVDFDGIETGKDGSYTLKFGDVTAVLDENNEIALERFHADTAEFDNIAANTRSVQVVKDSSSQPQTVHFPPCKIATVQELADILNLMQDVAVFASNEIGVTMTMKQNSGIWFDQKIAKCLGFLTNDGNLSGLVQAFLQDEANLSMVGNNDNKRLTISKINRNGALTLFVKKENYIWKRCRIFRFNTFWSARMSCDANLWEAISLRPWE